jgi:hypothetical protein
MHGSVRDWVHVVWMDACMGPCMGPCMSVCMCECMGVSMVTLLGRKVSLLQLGLKRVLKDPRFQLSISRFLNKVVSYKKKVLPGQG